MTVYFVTGKLGGGKSLVAVKRIQEYHEQGRPVATNVDVYLEHMLKPTNKTARHIRVPDKPSAEDLMALGHAYEGDYDEEKSGLVVLDELGSWLNSRSWNDKSRSGFIEWAIHARKFGWDVIFLVQHVEMVDVQIRNALCEYLVVCRRMDRLKIPGTNLRPPRVHVGTVYYASTENAKMKVETWTYRGNDIFKAYDTRQAFSSVYSSGSYSVLPPAYHAADKETTKERTTQEQAMKTLITMTLVVSVLAAVIYGITQTVAMFKGEKPFFETETGTAETVENAEQESTGIMQTLTTSAVPIMGGHTAGTYETDSAEIDIADQHYLGGYDYHGYIKSEEETTLVFAEPDTGVIIHYTQKELAMLGKEVIGLEIGVLILDVEGVVEIHRSK